MPIVVAPAYRRLLLRARTAGRGTRSGVRQMTPPIGTMRPSLIAMAAPGVLGLPLHEYFRNADGSLTSSAWFTLVVVSLAWSLWALGVLIAPGWVLTRIGLPRTRRAVTVLRLMGVVAAAVAVVVTALVLGATPGKLY